MGRRLRSEVEWRPEKPRSRVSLVMVALGVAVALVIGIGLHNARSFEPSHASIAPGHPDENAEEAYAGRPLRQREARLPSYSTEPRTSPSPRRAAAPRRAPQPRGELTEAETSVDR